MSRQVSRVAIVSSIVRKDIKEFSRDQLYIFLSVLGLVLFAVAYYLVPDSVEESITLGVSQTGLDDLVAQLEAGGDAEGLRVVEMPSAEELEAAVDAGELQVGVAFPDDFGQAGAGGDPPTVRVFTDVSVPPEIRDAMGSFVREIAYTVAGHELPVTSPEGDSLVLGEDRAGDQTSLRDDLLPMLGFFVLMIETFALSSLIASEVLNRTVIAVLATPARLGDFLAAKTIYGTLLTAGQALLLLAVLGALTSRTAGPLVVVVLLGAVMFTGVAMIAGSAGRDVLGTLFSTMALVLPLMIPAFSVLFPGTAAPWVQAMPSYPIIHTLREVTAYGAGWSDISGSLLAALAWVVILYLAGLLVLRRKVRAL